MIAKKSNSPDYDYYYDMPEVTNPPDGSNNAELDLPRSRNDQVDDIPWEYVYDEDDGVYVLERRARPSGSNPTAIPAPEARRPGHKRADPGVYDELDYELSPRTLGGSDHPATLENRRKRSKQTKVLILSILLTLLIGAVSASIVLIIQGNYFSIFEKEIY